MPIILIGISQLSSNFTIEIDFHKIARILIFSSTRICFLVLSRVNFIRLEKIL